MTPAGPASRRICGGCGRVVDEVALCPVCPNAGDGGDHVLLRELDEARIPFGLAGDPRFPDRPFLRWRHRLHAWHLAARRGLADADFVALVDRLERAIAEVDARPSGFVMTPLVTAPELAAEIGPTAPLGALLLKDETGNVAGSHKARHLFGILLALEVLEVARDRPLAIASCGNAALAATVLAKAAGRPIRVFVPPDARHAVVRRLGDLDADLVVCHRTPSVSGDPCVHAFRDAVADGAIPFSCQGSDNGLAIDGGETLGWEIVTQLGGAPIDRVFVQVGGGALGSAVGRALQQAVRAGMLARMPRLHAVQTRAVHPFVRAYKRLSRRLDRALFGWAEADPGGLVYTAERADRLAHAYASDAFQSQLREAVVRRGDLMWPWEDTAPSVAHGILDDETYDWLALARAMLEGGGYPIVVEEAALVHANRLALEHAGIAADETGTAGLAGLIALEEVMGVRSAALHGPRDERCLALVTGARRD